MLLMRRDLVKLGGWLIGIAPAMAGRMEARADEPRQGDRPRPAGPTPAVADGQMEAWWVDLEKGEPDSSRALLKLAERPNETVAFLKAKMRPLAINPDWLKTLLIALGNPEEKIWRPAFEELEYLDPRLAIDLETLMREVVDSPARQRMVAVLSGRVPESLEDKQVDLRGLKGGQGFNFFSTPGGSWWAEHRVERINVGPWADEKKKWTRAVRAVALLEHIGSPDAIAVLKDMATGHPEAQPTRAAAEALARVAAKAR